MNQTSVNAVPERIVVAADAAAPYVSAAQQAADLLDLPVEESAAADASALNIGPPQFAAAHGPVSAMGGSSPAQPRWPPPTRC
jgi:hypothetical protein